MKKNFIILLLLCLTTISWCANIVYPWRATTAIVERGKSFEVWLNADTDQIVGTVVLKAQFHAVTPKISIETGNWVYDESSQNSFNTRITVKVPHNAPADRYDIVINTSQGAVISPAGVKVIKSYKSNYYILHISDLHAFQRGHETVLSRLSLVADIANIINPELVFNTGDNLYRPNEERMNELYGGNSGTGTKGLNQFNAATFTVPGNHDIDFDNLPENGFYKEKAAWWNQWWGLQSYQFSYGKGRFLAFNNGWEGFKPAQQYAAIDSWLKKEGAGNLRVGLAHIRNKEMAAFDSIANPGLILLGHNHHIASQNPSPLNGKPVQFIVNSMRDNMEFNLFKVDEKTGKYTPVGGSTAQVVYVENPEDSKTPALYKPKLTLSFAKNNDGTSTTNTATIVNKLNFPLENARVRFVMPTGNSYSVSNGKIEQAFDGSTVHVVDVLVNLEPNNTTLVEIKKVERKSSRNK